MYTLNDTSELVARIDDDLALLVKELRTEFGSNVRSILLCGGYGRGEGSIIVKSGKMQPYNDYDVLLVMKRRVSGTRLRECSVRLAKQLGIRFVDLGIVLDSKIDDMPHTQFVFDLSTARVLWGDDIRSRLPSFSASELALRDIQFLLRNRLICFFELTPASFFSQQSIEAEDHQQLLLQLSKAAIATHVSTLIDQGTYVASYEQQMGLTEDPVLKLAYQIKLGLSDPLQVDPRVFWMEVAERYLACVDTFLSDQYVLAQKSETVLVALQRHLKRLFFQQAETSEQEKRRIEYVVFLMICAYRNHEDTFVDVRTLLMEWFEVNECPQDLYTLSQRVSSLWEEYHH